MAENKKIGGSMFGYNKGDVNKYISGLAENYKKESDKKDEEIKKLKDANASLAAKVSEYEKTIKDFEAQKEIVAAAIIKAEAEAAKIAERANQSAAARKEEIDDELKSERMNLEAAKAEVVTFQKLCVKLISNFEAQLQMLTGAKSEDEQKEA